MWIIDEKLTWILPSGERRPGRIAIGIPKYVETESGSHTEVSYALDGMRRERRAFGEGALQAMSYAWQMVGYELYWLFCEGVRVQRSSHADEESDPQADTAMLLGILGPLIREHGNPRGVADPEGKLAELEAKRDEVMAEMQRKLEDDRVKRGE